MCRHLRHCLGARVNVQGRGQSSRKPCVRRCSDRSHRPASLIHDRIAFNRRVLSSERKRETNRVHGRDLSAPRTLFVNFDWLSHLSGPPHGSNRDHLRGRFIGETKSIRTGNSFREELVIERESKRALVSACAGRKIAVLSISTWSGRCHTRRGFGQRLAGQADPCNRRPGSEKITF